MKLLRKIKFVKSDIIITDPKYFIKEDKIQDLTTAPQRKDFYPKDWSFSDSISIDSPEYENSLKYENDYKKAYQEWSDRNPDDWDICNYGDDMNILGFTDYITHSTIYGPWSCTTYKYDSDGNAESFGKFTSDSGMVGVFKLQDVLRYNSKYTGYTSEPWSNTTIYNFTGNVFIVNYGSDEVKSSDIRIIGAGSINFYTQQTGW